MRKQLTMGNVGLAPRQAVAGLVRRPALLTVQSGRVWVTEEGCAVDHWLDAGEALLLTPLRLVVIEADKAGAVCHVSPRDQAAVWRNGPARPDLICRQHDGGALNAGLGMQLRRCIYFMGAFFGILLGTGCELQHHSHTDEAAAVAVRADAQPRVAAVFVTARRMTPAEKQAYDDAYMVSQAAAAQVP